MSKIPERFLWATSLLNIEPHQNILEIGCGAGLLAEQICYRLTNGKYTAIDKSASMIKNAQKRNLSFIEKGMASFIASEFNKAYLQASFYDIIVAFNVNFFFKNATAEFNIIRKILKPLGKLYIFFQAPFEVEINAVEPIRQNLLKNSFEQIHLQTRKLTPASAICISARSANPSHF